MRRLIDDFLPQWDRREVHSTFVAASPERVDAALRSLGAGEMPLARLLLKVRGVARLAAGGPVIDSMLRAGFRVLADHPGEQLVLGFAGRPWLTQIDRLDDFHAYDRPASVRAATDFVMARVDGGTRVTTETRIRATDAAGRRWFSVYWLVVMPGSALIRRDMLRAIKRRAGSEA